MTAIGATSQHGQPEHRALLEGLSRFLQAGDLKEARRMAEAALAQGLEHPVLFNLRAVGHEEAGRFEAALADLRKAHFLAPEDFSVLNALGLACARTERFAEAVACYDRALAIRPDFAPSWFNRGWALERLGEVAKAGDAYGRAAELDPRHVLAWSNAAWLAARRGDGAAARAAAERALELKPDCAMALLAIAAVELDEPELAEKRLQGLLARTDLEPAERALALGGLGDALDRLDRPAGAFAAYVASNRQFEALAAPRFAAPGQETAAMAVAWMVRWAERLPAEPWRGAQTDARGQGGEREHVFLMGFPRSGTTLIESLLGAHPDVVTLEERNTLEASVRAFMAGPEAVGRLESTTDRGFASYRAAYWRAVAGFGVDPKGKIFIDKNPFNTPRLPLIRRLFPGARVILAIRDPRDVVFSCFRRRFDFNPSTYELLDLERAARFYDSIMSFAELMREKLGLAEHRLVYERLVEDFEAEARAVCAFVGADWRDDLSDFADRARRGDVASASAAQIARGLYADGVGQWRRYRAQLEPSLAILKPWVERLGYPAD